MIKFGKVVANQGKYLKITINDDEQLNLNLEKLGLYNDSNPCIVFRSNSFSHINENSNCTELEMHEFKLYEKSKEDYKAIEELVERATPKEIIYDYMCPKCQNICETENQKYCDNCGQALDWSE